MNAAGAFEGRDGAGGGAVFAAWLTSGYMMLAYVNSVCSVRFGKSISGS